MSVWGSFAGGIGLFLIFIVMICQKSPISDPKSHAYCPKSPIRAIHCGIGLFCGKYQAVSRNMDFSTGDIRRTFCYSSQSN